MQEDIPLAPLTEEELAKVKILPVPTTARMTVVESVYHQLSESPPVMLYRGEGHQFSQDLKSDEDSYEHRCVARAEWSPIDHGWLDRCSHLLLRNDYASPVRGQPIEDGDHTLEIAFCESDVPHLLLCPGESNRIHPANLQEMRIRSRTDGTRYTICIVPE